MRLYTTHFFTLYGPCTIKKKTLSNFYPNIIEFFAESSHLLLRKKMVKRIHVQRENKICLLHHLLDFSFKPKQKKKSLAQSVQKTFRMRHIVWSRENLHPHDRKFIFLIDFPEIFSFLLYFLVVCFLKLYTDTYSTMRAGE